MHHNKNKIYKFTKNSHADIKFTATPPQNVNDDQMWSEVFNAWHWKLWCKFLNAPWQLFDLVHRLIIRGQECSEFLQVPWNV